MQVCIGFNPRAGKLPHKNEPVSPTDSASIVTQTDKDKQNSHKGQGTTEEQSSAKSGFGDHRNDRNKD
ncbi:hypothetical protein SBOR_10146 [Sclerotinia borealis F-4128]|uniref:Uncharacterized protein n=1 Tax=Sclerotinia borealis (strain F-4128) TaxID=1432307 RepID=W9C4H9_SCLBF|nr:hypothetical protein SBOR_10146 [Sclerotinia borealis F-4128]